MAAALQRAWLRRGLLAWLLWPVSLVFGALAGIRRWLYQAGVLRAHSAGVPVIVVGNVVAGGSGKTPVVMALVHHLRARGLRPGVVSRGYGRQARDCREVHAASAPGDVGDEPLLIHQACDVPVFVAPRRIDAARALRAAHPATDVIVCDDGLQHYALQRDLEICVFDGRGVGNGFLLPAGPLREPWPRPVTLILYSGRPAGIAGFSVRRQLAPYAHRADGERIALDALRGQPLHAVAAIAHPRTFFNMLQARGLTLASTQALPDHDALEPSSLPPVAVGVLACTEKDAVKLWRHRPDAWAIGLELEIDGAFWSELDRQLDPRLSSAHGPQTA